MYNTMYSTHKLRIIHIHHIHLFQLKFQLKITLYFTNVITSASYSERSGIDSFP